MSMESPCRRCADRKFDYACRGGCRRLTTWQRQLREWERMEPMLVLGGEEERALGPVATRALGGQIEGGKGYGK
jgi:hypothetical protein